MNPKSIRFRLTALYSGVLILSIAIAFAVFYWVTERELYGHTDMLLTAHAARINNVLEQEQWQLGGQMSARLLTDIYSDTPGMLVFITDGTGNPTSVSQTVDGMNAAVARMFATVRSASSPRIVNDDIAGNSMRFLLTPIRVDGSLKGVVMMGHPIDVIRKSLSSLVDSLLIVYLVLVIPAVVGGYLLAGRALVPIREIGRQMREIGSETLKRRVGNPGTHDELEDLAITFNGLLDRMEDAFAHERQFIGDMAHELKTPLSTLRGGIDLALTKKRTPAEYDVILREALVDTDRLSATLTDILNMAWSNAETLNTGSDRTDISLVAGEVAEIVQKLAQPRTITVETRIDDGLVIRGKKNQLFRALLNVADNAVKYCRENGRVTLVAKARRGKAVVIVRDTGPGIPKTDLPRIFDRYFRGTSTATVPGSGLGLSIAKAVVSACGGTIDIVTGRNRGTAVTIEFPLEDPERTDGPRNA
jgi:signal transduction histidine kinase